MPAIETGETPGERTMRRWYEAKLADNAAQILHQAKARRVLNRLAIKTQNGTLGKPDPVADEFVGEDMQVRIGDQVNHYQVMPETSASETSASRNSLLKKAALAAALLGLGGGTGAALPWIVGMFQAQPPTMETPTDSDTLFELHLGEVEPQ